MNLNEYSSLALAFIGDAHYNLIVKRHIIDEETNSNSMQKKAAAFCSAKGQAKALQYLLDNQLLTEQEITVFKRGRNAKGHHGAPKNTDIITYKIATGFETLWGYWYLSNDEARMKQIWDIIETKGED